MSLKILKSPIALTNRNELFFKLITIHVVTKVCAHSMYNDIMEAHNFAAEQTIPLKTKVKKRVPWKKAKRITTKTKRANPTQVNVDVFNTANEERNMYGREQKEYVKTKINQLKKPMKISSLE